MANLSDILRLAQSGRLAQALDQWQKLNREHPLDPQLWVIGGSLHARSDDTRKASRCFKKALELDRNNVQARVGLGQVLRRRGMASEAVEQLTLAQQAAPEDVEVATALAMALRDAGRIDEAVALLEPVPDSGEQRARYTQANLLLALQRPQAARAALSSLAGELSGNVAVLNALGMAEFACEDPHAAVSRFEQALELAPDHLAVLTNLARAQEQLGLYVQARDSLARRRQLQPGDYDTELRYAALCRELGDDQTAGQVLEDLVREQPDQPAAYRDLASLHESRNRLEQAAEILAEARERFPADQLTQLLGARLLRRGKQEGEALAELERIGELDQPFLEQRRQQELAQNHDRLGNADAAWAAMQRFNALTQAQPAPDDYLDTLLERYRQTGLHRLRQASNGSDVAVPPIFVIGLPRSGTTLMGRILGAHPDTVELEETPTLNQLARDVAFPDLALSDEQRRALRDDYMRLAADHADISGRRIIDRNPLSTVHLPLIRNLWPEAPVIFMQRHPGDTVLSCLFQDFRLNWMTRHFLDPQSAVDQCRKVIELWLQWREVLDPPALTVEYETLVASPEVVVKQLCDDLGLSYDPQMIEQRDAAPAPRTASYAQVREPIHTSSVGRWRRYQSHFGQHAETLRELAQRLGYAETP